jgi:hypothetical protein
VPPQIHSPSTSNKVALFYDSPSSLDLSSSVRRSQGDQSQLVSRASGSVCRSATPRLDDIVTLDELWFDFFADHEHIWFASEKPLSNRELHMLQSPKLMITIIWNPSGFHVVSAFPNGLKFNTGYYTREILQEIKNWREPQGVGSARKLIVHADNARSHTAKLLMDFLEANNMRKLLIRRIHLT